MNIIYFLDICIKNGKISRFYYKLGGNSKLKTGVIKVGNFKIIRVLATRECYLSWIKIHNPTLYSRLKREFIL